MVEEGEERDVETAQEKRLRLAKQYLAQLESEGKSEETVGTCMCWLTSETLLIYILR